MAKRRKHRKGRKGTKRKNPFKYKVKVKEPAGKTPKGRNRYKVVHKKTTKGVMTPGEIQQAKSKIRMMVEQAKNSPAKVRRQRAKKAIALLKKLGARIGQKNVVKADIKAMRDIAKNSKPGTKVSVKTIYYSKGKKRKGKKRKSSRRRRKSGKRKSAKRASKRKGGSRRRKSGSRRRSIVLKRRGSKVTIRASRKRKAPKITISKASNPSRRRRKGGKKAAHKRRSRRSSGLRKGKSYKYASLRVKPNPLGGIMGKVEQYTGHSVAEIGSLALGGALYGAVNGATAKYLKPVHSILSKVPVVGSALPTLAIGAVLNFLGERQNIAALTTLGKGLVGASVVGMGVNASQMVPGLKAMSGVDYTLEGLGEGDDADFGFAALPEGVGADDDADFGGVDYTLEGDGAQMGEIPYGGVDYTMEGYGNDEADFGSTPEGLGQGQMG